jgi:hypothetical protein
MSSHHLHHHDVEHAIMQGGVVVRLMVRGKLLQRPKLTIITMNASEVETINREGKIGTTQHVYSHPSTIIIIHLTVCVDVKNVQVTAKMAISITFITST